MKRPGLTLVELLVVIAILGILIGMVLPAVQQIRASAAKLSCQNHLKQLSLAVHLYHDTADRMPTGHSPALPGQAYPLMGWIAHLLPHLEQEALWQQTRTAYQQQPSKPFQAPHTGGTTVLRVAGCPADSRTHTLQTSYGRPVALTSYLGISGTDLTRMDGVLYSRSRTRLTDVLDGTSSTVMIGERPPSPDYWYGWWYAATGQKGSGSLDAVLGVRERRIITHVPVDGCGEGPYSFQPGRINNPCDVFRFWSFHSGGANFSFADGSVKFLNYSADAVLPALATRAGGEVSVSFD